MTADPIRAHEARCPLCRDRQWCDEVMDLIARREGYLSWPLKIAAQFPAGAAP